jgi:hypothetical protein
VNKIKNELFPEFSKELKVEKFREYENKRKIRAETRTKTLTQIVGQKALGKYY